MRTVAMVPVAILNLVRFDDTDHRNMIIQNLYIELEWNKKQIVVYK